MARNTLKLNGKARLENAGETQDAGGGKFKSFRTAVMSGRMPPERRPSSAPRSKRTGRPPFLFP